MYKKTWVSAALQQVITIPSLHSQAQEQAHPTERSQLRAVQPCGTIFYLATLFGSAHHDSQDDLQLTEHADEVGSGHSVFSLLLSF